LQAKETELEEQWRTERSKLAELQAQLDRLDYALDNSVMQASKP
jgi:hypothetical protein